MPRRTDLEHVMDDRDELKEFASRVGRDVSDEELEDYFAAPEEGEADPLEESAETETDGDAGPDAESRADDEEPVAADAADAAPECEPADDADEQPARRESAE